MARDSILTMEEARQIVRSVLPQGRILASGARGSWTVQREKDLATADELSVTYPSGVRRVYTLV